MAYLLRRRMPYSEFLAAIAAQVDANCSVSPALA